MRVSRTNPIAPVQGLTARPARATKSAALLLATILAVPAFFVLTLIERLMSS